MQQTFHWTEPTAPARRFSPTSQAGARNAQASVSTQMVALLALYKQQGPQTDAEAAEALGIYRTSVIPRRRALMARRLVAQHGSKKNAATGVDNARWGIS